MRALAASLEEPGGLPFALGSSLAGFSALFSFARWVRRQQMNRVQLKASYLQKAKEAEEKAANASDAQVKEEWLKTANEYRRLAQLT